MRLATNLRLSHLNLWYNLISDSGAAEFVETLQINNALILLELEALAFHGFAIAW